MKELEKHCRKRWESLKSERSSWMDHWRDISKVLLPRSGRFLATQNNKGDERSVDIQDNSGTRALRTLAGGMMAGMTSPARPWFRLTTLNPELDEDYEVKVWMSQTTSLMQMIFTRSNVYRALHMAYEELGAFGTSATVVLDDFDRVIHCMPLTIGEFALSTDARGRINTLYREFRLSVAATVAEFGYANCSKATQQAFDRQRYDDWVTIINAIEPRDLRDPGKQDNRNMPWRSVYFEESSRGRNSSGILRETGFRHFPALCGRWHVTGGDIYGNSPGMEALGDLRQLQSEQYRKAQAIDYMANPPIIVPTDYKDNESSIMPGGTIFADTESQAKSIRSAFQVNLDLQGVLLDIQDCRQRINEAFYKDIFLMLTEQGGNRMTATEVAERHEEKMLMLGPVLDRLNNEVLDPLISLVFERMVLTDMLPPLPDELQGVELNVDYISILAQSQKAITTNAVDRFTNSLGVLAGYKPEVIDKLDADYWADYYADSLGIDPRLVVPGEKVALIRQQRAEAAQQQAQVEQAAQLASAAKDVGSIQQVSSPTPDQVAGMFMGY